MAGLTLYYAVPSRGMVAHWMLEELGQPFDKHLLSLDAGDHKTEAFLALNPMGRVPVLTHGDQVVTETAAIVTYLADAFPDANLGLPLDSPLRADYLRWIFFATNSAEPSILRKAMGELKVVDEPWSDVEEVAATLAAALKGKEFIVGDSFTAADVMIGTTIMWGTRLMPVLPALPELVDYWGRLSQRPAWLRAQAFDQAQMAS